jgi:nicotinamidase-related amidase
MTDSPLIRREDSLLLVVDIQEKLFPVIAGREQLRDNALKLVRFARIIDLPVVVSEQEKLGPTLPDLSRELNDAPVHQKVSFDCFGQTDLSDALTSSRRKNLILFGVEAHICVAQTALSALSRFENVHVVADAIGSRTEMNYNTALTRLTRNGVTVTTTEMFMYELLGRAGTDEFRSVLKLVK